MPEDLPDRTAAARPVRIALLVGNGAYPGQRLANPPNDAQLLAKTLRSLDFNVELLIDAGKARLEQAIVRFGERVEHAGSAAVALFYFAGHGVQYMGSNYLLPVDAELPATRYLKSAAVKVDAVVEELTHKDCDANIIVLDACRNNPIPEAYSSTRDVTQGLAGLHQVPDRTLVAFSTAAGAVALDGDGQNSPYAAALASQLNSPGLSVLDIFAKVAGSVVTQTNRQQSPAIFVQGEPPRVVLQPFKSGLSEMTTSTTTTLAEGRQPALHRAVPGPSRDDSRRVTAGRAQHFRDFGFGPSLVVAPAGAFDMGNENDELNERPVRRVVFDEPFAIARFPVTLKEFALFVRTTGYSPTPTGYTMKSPFPCLGDLEASKNGKPFWQRPGFSQTDDHPVVGVSWFDAKAYAAWLGSETGKHYRLPSEAEWEYAARAGTAARYAWGDTIVSEAANYDHTPELRKTAPLVWRMWPPRGTHPVNAYEPNAWGLYNMHGNVAEWVEDPWQDNYDGAPSDGSARLLPSGPGAHFRVIRGGSWKSSARELRAGARNSLSAELGASWVGFRLARTLV